MFGIGAVVPMTRRALGRPHGRVPTRRTIAASFALRYGWSSGVAFAPYLLYHCVPTITLDKVSFKFNEHGSFERAALHHPAGVMLPREEMAPHPSIRWLSSPQALLERLRTSLLQQAQPIVHTLFEWSHFSRRGIWGMITSAWGSQCMQIFGEIGEQTHGLSWVRQFFAGNDVVSQMQPQFYPVTYQHVTHVYQGQLLPVLPPSAGVLLCELPLISQEERAQRQRAWMKHMIEPRVTPPRV